MYITHLNHAQPLNSTTHCRYPVNDDARVHNERQMALYNATVRFQATRDYDPVKGKFYNPNKETQYVQERAVIQKNHHIESPQSRLRLKDKTDGELYNIVNNSTLDQVRDACDNNAGQMLFGCLLMYMCVYTHIGLCDTYMLRYDGCEYTIDKRVTNSFVDVGWMDAATINSTRSLWYAGWS